MSKLLSLFIGALLCTTVLASELWSDAVTFDGSPITSTPITLLTTDQIFYSSALADGDPRSLELTATDTADSTKVAELFYDDSQTAVEGTASWNYEAPAYDDFSKSDVYELKETIVTSEGTEVLTRNVKILPEPACFVLFAILGGLLIARRKGALMLLVLTVASVGAFADVTVTSVTAQQAWPFKRSVVINYTLESNTQGATVFSVDFYGTFDDGETIFNLKDRGTLEKEGASGVLFEAGTHKVIWTPSSDLTLKSSNLKIKVSAADITSEATYLVVDLSGGTGASSYPVSYLSSVPEGGWGNEYKTTKLVLRLVQPGTFTMGSPSDEIGRDTSASGELQHQVTLTKPYYIGIFEMTQGQYERIMGKNPADIVIAQDHSVNEVSYDMIRGTNQGQNWPADNNVDSDSFIGVLRNKTGLVFDLPTEAQWEYACRAETTTALNSGKDLTNATVCPNMAEVGRYTHNTTDGKGNYFVAPGQYLVNNWGIYDMHGNLAELCLDYYAGYSADSQTDPKGPSTGTLRVQRGGDWEDIASECRSARRVGIDSNYHHQTFGFRVVVEQ
ncbi:formylglycine-generating enzyme family protein [bacterium]|nr:formylglycine-generating enzyme family protein [bacterium]